MNFSNYLSYVTPYFITLIVIELLHSKRSLKNKDLYVWKDFLASVSMSIFTIISTLAFKSISAVAIFSYAFSLFNSKVNGIYVNILGWESFENNWYTLLLCIFCGDFTFYWYHRFSHTIRILWAGHIVHHSSEKFNFGTAIRTASISAIYRPLFYIWMPLIGFSTELIIISLTIDAIWQFNLHSIYIPRLGFFEFIFNTGESHQVHHAKNLKYMDKNHGGILIIFDRLFGTYEKLNKEIQIEYGVTNPPNSHNPFIVLTHEYLNLWRDIKKVKKFNNKINYIFKPPGWSHDRSSLTVKQIREAKKKM